MGGPSSDRAYIRLNRHMTRLNLHWNKNLRVCPGLLQDFCASVHAAMARAVQHERSWVRRGSVRHSPCARTPLANAPPPGAHTPGKCSSREWGLAIRSSSAFRMNASPGRGTNLPAAAAALLEHCANAAARCTRPTLALASFVHGQSSNHSADGESRT